MTLPGMRLATCFGGEVQVCHGFAKLRNPPSTPIQVEPTRALGASLKVAAHPGRARGSTIGEAQRAQGLATGESCLSALCGPTGPWCLTAT